MKAVKIPVLYVVICALKLKIPRRKFVIIARLLCATTWFASRYCLSKSKSLPQKAIAHKEKAGYLQSIWSECGKCSFARLWDLWAKAVCVGLVGLRERIVIQFRYSDTLGEMSGGETRCRHTYMVFVGQMSSHLDVHGNNTVNCCFASHCPHSRPNGYKIASLEETYVRCLSKRF